MASFKIKAQPEQRLWGCAKRVTHGSQTMPLAGQDLQTAHWLGIRFSSRFDNDVRPEVKNLLNMLQIYSQLKITA
jgi:hypothetical protein